MGKKTSEDLWSYVKTFTVRPGILKNGHVLAILHQENMSLAACARTLSLRESPFPVSAAVLKTTVKHVSDKLSKLRKRLDRDWERIIAFLEENFKYQPVQSPLPSTSTPAAATLSSTMTPQLEILELPQPISTSTPVLASSSGPAPEHTSPSSRRKCRPCAIKAIALKNISKTLADTRQQLRSYRQLKQRNRELEQKFRRSAQSAALWRLKYKKVKSAASGCHSKVPLQTESRGKENKNLKIGKSQLLNSLHKQHEEYKANLAVKDQEVSKLRREIGELVEHNHYLLSIVLEEAETGTSIQTREEQLYGPDIRKCVYKALLSNVPVESVSSILQYFTQTLAGKTLEKVPHHTNVARMAYELGVLALIQAGEALENSQVATLAFDATTVTDKHLNEFHIVTYPPQQALTVSTTRLPGGRACDYAAHITASLNEVACTYADAYNLDRVVVKQNHLNKLKSCLTDRAPVNHCVLQHLQADLEVELLELNCNVHPLDGLASSARATLLQQDKELGLKGPTGKEGCAVAYIYNLSKLRYSYKGDPATFKSYLKENGVAPGTFVRYVGNRLHILFHMAGIVILHEQLLMTFLNRHTKNEVSKNLLCLMKKREVMVQIHALGICGKIITGPWMTLVYGNAVKHTNLQMVPILQLGVENLRKLTKTPQEMVAATRNIFGQPLSPDDDDVLRALQSIAPSDLLHQTLALLVSGFLEVLDRQLNEYIRGKLSTPTAKMLDDTRSAPTHNIHAERALGMTDCLLRRAPNATIGFIDAKVKAKTNHTLQWLESKSSEEQKQLIRFAIKQGATVRKAVQHFEFSVDEEIKRRRLQAIQKQDTASRRKLEQGVRQAIAKNASPEDQIFQKVGSDQKSFLRLLLTDKTQLTGRLLSHTWELEDGQEILYFGRVKDIKLKNKKWTLSIAYWGQEETSSEDFDLTLEAIITDMVTGDLFFEV